MHITPIHRWDLSPSEAIALQRELAVNLIDRPLDLAHIKLIAGVDVSVKAGQSQAAVVVVTYPELTVIETIREQMPVTYPYIPGLLTFREGPVLLAAFERLQHVPDVFIFDGMGRIHPRKMGIAAHMGLWLQQPTVGVGKTHFIGDYDEPAIEKGARADLTYQGARLGVVLRTRRNVKPVYVSPGHLADIETAVELVLAVTPRYRLPRLIRLAHHAAGEFHSSD